MRASSGVGGPRGRMACVRVLSAGGLASIGGLQGDDQWRRTKTIRARADPQPPPAGEAGYLQRDFRIKLLVSRILPLRISHYYYLSF